MSKFLILSAALAMVGGVSTIASAQCGCGGMQSYQRYSYQPSVVSPTLATQNGQAVASSQSSSANAASTSIGQPQASAVQPQSYQRYSYQPQPVYQSYQQQPGYRSQPSRSYSSSPRRSPWEYAKGERQRYLP